MRTWAIRLATGAAIALMLALVIGYLVMESVARSLCTASVPLLGEFLLEHLALCVAIEVAVSVLFRLL